jgi:hypothetical protein
MSNIDDGFGRTIGERYLERFGEGLPTMSWHGSAADLLRLTERAIEEGRALSTADIDAAQGLNPPSPNELI